MQTSSSQLLVVAVRPCRLSLLLWVYGKPGQRHWLGGDDGGNGANGKRLRSGGGRRILHPSHFSTSSRFSSGVNGGEGLLLENEDDDVTSAVGCAAIVGNEWHCLGNAWEVTWWEGVDGGSDYVAGCSYPPHQTSTFHLSVWVQDSKKTSINHILFLFPVGPGKTRNTPPGSGAGRASGTEPTYTIHNPAPWPQPNRTQPGARASKNAQMISRRRRALNGRFMLPPQPPTPPTPAAGYNAAPESNGPQAAPSGEDRVLQRQAARGHRTARGDFDFAALL
ncbi:Protein of unknown function [Gryllus bimaculatus]|nr:Protein of unknown function [Gryllus bimaculatus]